MARLQDIYKEKIVADLMAKFSYKSSMEVPRITKITLNMGLSEAVADKKVIDHATEDLAKIAGQKPVVTRARKSIAGFKILFLPYRGSCIDIKTYLRTQLSLKLSFSTGYILCLIFYVCPLASKDEHPLNAAL